MENVVPLQNTFENEPILYQSDLATITTARAIIAGKTYAMRNVTSVMLIKQPKPVGCAIALVIMPLIGAIIAYPLVEIKAIPIILGVLFATIFAITYNSEKPKYFIRLTVASSETDVLSTTSESDATAMVNAINEAIARWG